MIDTLLIISIAILSYFFGRLHNYTRWLVSGRIYAAAKKTYELNQRLYEENRMLHFENEFLKREKEK